VFFRSRQKSNEGEKARGVAITRAMVMGIIGLISGTVATPLGMSSAATSAESIAVSSVGIAQSTQQQRQDGRQEQQQQPNAATLDPRLAKFRLTTLCDSQSSRRDQVHAKIVVLQEGKLYLDDPAERRFPDAHPFEGFYLEYPFRNEQPVPMGLVSTISRDPPALNWIFVDRDTHELRYGNKTQSIEHVVGPWDWSAEQSRLMLDDGEDFVALEERPGIWQLCWDERGDHLADTRGRRRALDCLLQRNVL
jgi:type II secretory pathway pseudopilin PulG